MLFGINDYGNPSGLMPHEYNAYFGSVPQLCKAFGPGISHAPISQGNITIKLP